MMTNAQVESELARLATEAEKQTAALEEQDVLLRGLVRQHAEAMRLRTEMATAARDLVARAATLRDVLREGPTTSLEPVHDRRKGHAPAASSIPAGGPSSPRKSKRSAAKGSEPPS